VTTDREQMSGGWMFAELVRSHRRRHGLTQNELAERCGVGVRTIRGIEAGKIGSPRSGTVRLLADGLGLGDADRELFYRAAVATDATAATPGTGDVATGWARVAPAQLPRDVAAFTGRVSELAALDALLTGDAEQSSAVVIGAVSGAPGVGKTALAVHWAHRMAERFPDGQLYLNLRGYHPQRRVMTTSEALRTLLDALGVPAERVPAGLDAQVGRYRSLLAGKRILVVLDNARDAEQVRPLLPGSPTSLAIVTSRSQMTPLVALDGARCLRLDPLSAADARELLARRLGAQRVAAEPQAVDAIIAACTRLPLALVITAGRAEQSGIPLAAVAAEVGAAGSRLDALDAGDRSSQVRAVFAQSYVALSPAAARLFRLIGLHPGPDATTAALASLAGDRPSDVHAPLTELVHANLLIEHAPGRYTFHDLLRVYAADTVHRHEPEPVRRAAVRRLLDHYLHTAHAAERLLHPLRDPIAPPLDTPEPGVTVESVVDAQQAVGWFATERAVLLAVLRYAADAGFESDAWRLAWTLETFLTRGGYRHDLADAWRTAAHAAERLDAVGPRAHALRGLAIAAIELRLYGDAYRCARRALALYTDVDDLVGQGYTHRDIAFLHWRRGNARAALHHAQKALSLFRAARHHRAVANELNGVGWYLAELGDYADALAHCEQALANLEQLGDHVGAAYTWDSLGYIHHRLREHRQAVECYHRALALHRRLGDRHDQADTLSRLGDTYEATGDSRAAHAALLQALNILAELDHPDTEVVRGKMAAMSVPTGTTGLALE
jgi:tetratricopeptide (TPR) repeat protein/transcriptional regulator with XRE-family HTH domain